MSEPTTTDLPWSEIAQRLVADISKSGLSVKVYSQVNNLNFKDLTAVLETGDPPSMTDVTRTAPLYDRAVGLPPSGDVVIAKAAGEPEPTDDPAALRERIDELEAELRGHRELRAKEQDLLSQRNAALHAIEGAKARLTSEKKGLAEIEEQIAALLAQGPGVQTSFLDNGPANAAPRSPWEDVLPAVREEQVKLVGNDAGPELPTLDAILGAVVQSSAMQAEKRALFKVAECYGTPWVVSAIWRDEDAGVARANVLRLYTKDEWQQLHEGKFGRAVDEFDQSDEAKERRQAGGAWCGLVVRYGRKVYVVGPQDDALHLVYGAEPMRTPAEEPSPAAAPVDTDSADYEGENQ